MSEPKGKGTRTDEPLAVICEEPEVVTVVTLHQCLKEIERKLDHIFALLVTDGVGK
jgi:hypothetical protein